MKGNASCHTTNEEFRNGYDIIFGGRSKVTHKNEKYRKMFIDMSEKKKKTTGEGRKRK